MLVKNNQAPYIRQIPELFAGTAPVLDLNFATMASLPGNITFSRASSATDGLYTDAAGRAFNTFSSEVPVLNSNGTGIAIWQSATNFLLNSNAPATQTTGSLGTGTYVLFGNGTGTLTSAAGTATGSGFGTISTLQGNFQVITITVAGTVTITKSGTVNWFDLQGQGFPTSHIVTAGATATRATDSATAPLPAIALAGGTMQADVMWGSSGASTGGGNGAGLADITASGGSNNNAVYLGTTATGKFQAEVHVAGSVILNVSGTSPLSVGSLHRANVSYGNQSFANIDGTLLGSAGAASPASLAVVNIGNAPNLSNQLNGLIQRLTIWAPALTSASALLKSSAW